jgi:hypothetical protein
MKLSSRSYPYPVVGNRDDVPGAAFQAALEMSTDRQAVYLDAQVKCSSKTINELVKKGDACFVVHVECSNTLYREAFEFDEESYRIQIPSDNLNDVVEVNVLTRAKKNLSSYRVDKAHSDYGSVVFNVEKGCILAVGDSHVFYVEAPFDALSPIGSIMQITETHKDGDQPMQAQYGGQKILIELSKKDFEDYKRLKATEGVSTALTMGIVLPVLVDAIYILQKSDEDDDLRWVRNLKRRIDGVEMKLEDNPLEIAQRILELPLKRTFASARKLAEADS